MVQLNGTLFVILIVPNFIEGTWILFSGVFKNTMGMMIEVCSGDDSKSVVRF